MYHLKHHKPKDQEPSSFFKKNIEKINIVDKPILDLACGYGRNGAFLAKRNHRVVFIDNDIECLKFIKAGKQISIDGDVDINNIRVLKKDLRLGRLPFPSLSTAGIIDIHYYNPLLIEEGIRVLASGGFFCFESIDARGNNVYELPDYGFIRDILGDFEIISYSERLVKPKRLGKSVIKIFAIKT